MPLNIDWQQILIHLFNFVILAGGLYFLLYNPVKNYMDKRADEYKNLEKSVKEKLSEADRLEAEYKRRLEAANSEIEEKRAEAMRESEKLCAERISEAKKQGERIIADAKAAAERQRQRTIEETREEIVELAAKMAEKVLHGEDIKNG